LLFFLYIDAILLPASSGFFLSSDRLQKKEKIYEIRQRRRNKWKWKNSLNFLSLNFKKSRETYVKE